MDQIAEIIGRRETLFAKDLEACEEELAEAVSSSSFLVIGGAGSIGQAVCREIFRRNPRKLHVVDLSENNLVELVRDLRSSMGHIEGEFATFALDAGSIEYDAFIRQGGDYDFVLNLSALKHVRSEKDPFTLMRMISVNILNTNKSLSQSIAGGSRKYFSVSSDKAANPVNMMGASKRIMEMFLMRRSHEIDISTARFANVAFSDGSLLQGFERRIQKQQPIAAPGDVKRYFITPGESGELCLMSCILGENRDIFFPRLRADLGLLSFAEIAVRFLQQRGYEPYLCRSEDEARQLAAELPGQGKWPCLITESDTTGEKPVEEFFAAGETLDLTRFQGVGVIKSEVGFDPSRLQQFEDAITGLRVGGSWDKEQLLELFFRVIPGFNHEELGRHLDEKM